MKRVAVALVIVLSGCNTTPRADAPSGRRWSHDGWSFSAPSDLERNTAPGTTGFALSRRPGAPILNVVLTTDPFEKSLSEYVEKERASVKAPSAIASEQTVRDGVVLEETWQIPGAAPARSLVFVTVAKGRGARLACMSNDLDAATQRQLCESVFATVARE